MVTSNKTASVNQKFCGESMFAVFRNEETKGFSHSEKTGDTVTRCGSGSTGENEFIKNEILPAMEI